jgi:hemoglobin-like flavoprotein
MDKKTLQILEDSLARCNADSSFLEKFYETFLASSPKVREKFKDTDFTRQRRALRASLHVMLLAAEDEEKGPERYLKDLAQLHSRQDLDVGAELYDLWIDSLLATVGKIDPQFSDRVERAWEDVMMVGVSYLLSHYHEPPKSVTG